MLTCVKNACVLAQDAVKQDIGNYELAAAYRKAGNDLMVKACVPKARALFSSNDESDSSYHSSDAQTSDHSSDEESQQVSEQIKESEQKKKKQKQKKKVGADVTRIHYRSCLQRALVGPLARY